MRIDYQKCKRGHKVVINNTQHGAKYVSVWQDSKRLVGKERANTCCGCWFWGRCGKKRITTTILKGFLLLEFEEKFKK